MNHKEKAKESVKNTKNPAIAYSTASKSATT